MFLSPVLRAILQDLPEIPQIVDERSVGKNDARNEKAHRHNLRSSNIERPFFGKPRAHKRLNRKGQKNGYYIEDSFQLPTLPRGNGGPIFGGDHAEEALAKLAVQNQNKNRKRTVARKSKAHEKRKMQENVGERVEHLPKVAHLVVFARVVPVQIVGELGKREKWNQNAGRHNRKHRTVRNPKPHRQKIKNKSNGSRHNADHGKFIRSLHAQIISNSRIFFKVGYMDTGPQHENQSINAERILVSKKCRSAHLVKMMLSP